MRNVFLITENVNTHKIAFSASIAKSTSSFRLLMLFAIRKNAGFFIVFLLAIVIRVIYFFDYHELLWDSAVYLGMGKYIFSFGTAGMWEHIRPIFLPIILGFAWLIKTNLIIFGRIVNMLFSFGAIILVYLLAKHFFDKEIALITTALFSFSGVFFYLNHHIYTEIPSLFFVLFGIYLFTERRPFLSGLFIGIAFLTKFPAGIFILPICATLSASKELKRLLYTLTGFLIAIAPYLFLNYLLYSNPFLPLFDAKEAINNVLGCNFLRYNPWWYYFSLIFKDNILNVFSLLGVFYYIRNFEKRKLAVILSLALPLIYFSQLHCRDFRYLLIFLPFVSMFAASGIIKVTTPAFGRLKNKKVGLCFFILLIVIVLSISILHSMFFYRATEPNFLNEKEQSYFRFLENKKVSGEVWSSNPSITVYSNAKINKIYYPIYDAGVSANFYNYLTKNISKISYVFIDNCGGGIICSPEDSVCIEQTKEVIKFLEENFERVYYAERMGCYYSIYKNQSLA